jgi:hypothetical protein
MNSNLRWGEDLILVLQLPYFINVSIFVEKTKLYFFFYCKFCIII